MYSGDKPATSTLSIYNVALIMTLNIQLTCLTGLTTSPNSGLKVNFNPAKFNTAPGFTVVTTYD
jgi:hypothetical protein